MRRFYRLSAGLLLGWLALSAGSVTAVRGAAPVSLSPRVVSESPTGLQVVFEAPAPSAARVTIEGGVFDRLALPGFTPAGEPGAPSVPVQRRLVAVPPGANVHLVIDAHAPTRLAGSYRLLPAPTLVPVWPDEEADVPRGTDAKRVVDATAYAVDAWTPTDVVAIAQRLTWRGVDLVVLEYAPVQVNPAQRAVRYTPWARATLTFGSGAAGGLAQQLQPCCNVIARSASDEAISNVSEMSTVEIASPTARNDTAGGMDSVLDSLVLNAGQARAWQRCRNVIARSASDEAITNVGEMSTVEIAGGVDSPTARNDITEAAGSPADTRWRIEVDTGGLQTLTYADLADAGVPVNDIDPRRLGLSTQGQPVAMWIPGETDGRFNTRDALYFYAPPPGSRWATYDVYWLRLDTPDGLRMGARAATPAGEPVVTRVPDSYTVNDQRLYLPYDLAYPDKWFQASITPPARPNVEVDFAQPPGFVATGDPVGLAWRLAPRPDLAVTRQVSAELNGTSIVENLTWPPSPTIFSAEASVAATEIQADNVLTVGTTAIAYFDSLEIDYQRVLQAPDGSILFGHDPSGRRQFQVGGLSDNQVVALDVSGPRRPVRLTGGTYDAETFSFASDGESSTEYLVADTTGIRKPTIASAPASSLRDAAHAVDYLVLSHAAFISELEPLVARRASQGLRALVVDVQQVYNEFGAGTPDPEVIRDFVSYAYHNWAVRPTYLLLVGDGTYDPLDYMGTGERNWLPPYLGHYDPVIGETASDNAYAAVDGDDRMPDIAVGRLAVDSAPEAAAVVAKILTYEDSAAGSWQQRFLLTTDDAPDPAGAFYELSDDVVADIFPEGAEVVRAYMEKKSNTTEQNAEALRVRDEIAATLNDDGAAVVQYIGHAGRREWAFPAIWTQRTRDDLERLHNGVYPFALSWTCWESYYIDPQEPALAEAMLSATGKGVIGVFGPTGLDVATGHDWLTRGFYTALFGGNAQTLGALTLAAKLHLFEAAPEYERLLDTFMLHGDPALRLRVDAGLTPQRQVFLPFVTR